MSIEWHNSLYPINKFECNEWTFNEDLEDKELTQKISFSSYALFKFLLYTNLIYSVEEIEITGVLLTEENEDELYYLINELKNLHNTALNPI